MSDLISLQQIAAEFGIEESTAAAWVKEAKLKSSRLMVGNDPITLYEQEEARATLQTKIAQAKAEAERIKAEAEAAREPTLREVMDKLKSMEKDIADVAELHEEIKRLSSANHIVFKTLTDFKTDTQDRLAGIKTLVVGARDEVKSIKRAPTVEPAPQKKSVAVIGVSRTHHPKLMATYGEAVDLKLIDPSDIRGIYQIRKHDIVYAMRKFTDQRHAEQMKSSKIAPTYLEGGIDVLESVLDGFALLTT